ncbi:MAG: hypothetical protein JW891_03200 [Candidatus Lokiarchaeota archaeon]|nr:hypothetical protein [Candidatus Lokiarchaeota archaeon]
MPPEKAWNEVYCNQILSKIHNYDFEVVYHQSLGCISEKYLPGYDLLNLPKKFLIDEKIIPHIFFWAGKCACVAYVFGLGDRGHNERIHCKEIDDIYQLYPLTAVSEPVINIDFEEFPSKRIFNPSMDLDEIALVFYSIIIQLSDNHLNLFEKLFSYFQKGFKRKFGKIKDIWESNSELFSELFNELFNRAPRDCSQEIQDLIHKRATYIGFNEMFDKIGILIDDSIKKFKKLRLKEKEKALLREKRRMAHYYKEES